METANHQALELLQAAVREVIAEDLPDLLQEAITQTKNVNGEPLLTVAQLCERRHCRPSTLSRERRNGTGIPFLRIGNDIFYSLANVLQWESERTYQNNSQVEEPRTHTRFLATEEGKRVLKEKGGRHG
jgi:AraC-like DNA-binding protein